MTTETHKTDGVHRLVDMVVEEVSLVDRAANLAHEQKFRTARARRLREGGEVVNLPAQRVVGNRVVRVPRPHPPRAGPGDLVKPTREGFPPRSLRNVHVKSRDTEQRCEQVAGQRLIADDLAANLTGNGP